MRKALLIFAASIAVTVTGANLAVADNLDFITSGQNHSGNQFASNDTVYWVQLGQNDYVPNGTTAWSANGVAATITFGFGGPGHTYVQVPAASGSWSGDFAPGQYVLANINQCCEVAEGEGTLEISFGHGVAGTGFQIGVNTLNAQGLNPFEVEIGVYDGSTLMGTFFGSGDQLYNADNNSATFFGIEDLSGANITSIKIAAFECGGQGGGGANCQYGFGINHLQLQDSAYSSTPEPASLALFGSGLGMLGYLRRRFEVRK